MSSTIAHEHRTALTVNFRPRTGRCWSMAGTDQSTERVHGKCRMKSGRPRGVVQVSRVASEGHASYRGLSMWRLQDSAAWEQARASRAIQRSLHRDVDCAANCDCRWGWLRAATLVEAGPLGAASRGPMCVWGVSCTEGRCSPLALVLCVASHSLSQWEKISRVISYRKRNIHI